MSIVYYPILKWKKGEQEALKSLKNQKNFYPIIEIFDEYSPAKFFAELKTYCNTPIYFDLNKFDIDCINDFVNYTALNNIPAYPIFYPDDLINNTLLSSKFAVKIPIPVDFEGPTFEEILNILSSYPKHNINLILDAGEVIDSRTANITFDLYYRIISNNIDILCDFENITICLTSFPAQLNIDSGEDMAYKRFDFLIFQKLFEEFIDSALNDKIQYSDYGVTKFTDTELDFSKMRYGILPKIKYTTKTQYIVKKGEKDRRQNIFTRSYIDISKEIVNSPYFFGEQFSYGDKCIYEKSHLPNAKPGNAKQWVTYCTNHHLTVLMEQLSNLSGF